MSSVGPEGPANSVDLYLDGLMNESERAGLEVRMGVELGGETELQKKIDHSLRRVFVPPVPTYVPEFSRDLAREQAPIRLDAWRRSRLVAAAAMLLIAMSGWRIWDFVTPLQAQVAQFPLDQFHRGMDEVYRAEVKGGLVPMWGCRDERELGETFDRNFGHSLRVNVPSGGAKVLGLSYSCTISPRTVYLIAQVDEKPVLVFADAKENDTGKLPTDPGLHFFKRTVGDLVLYEVSQFEKARLLDSFYLAEAGRD